MANEIGFDVGPGLSGITAYGILRNSTQQLYNTVGAAFETYNAANITDYDIALTEQGASGYFVGNMPAVPAGYYNLTIKQQAGASPAVNDTRIGGGEIQWDGTIVRNQVDVVSISGDATAADNFETMLDGTGGKTLSLGCFRIHNTDSNGGIHITSTAASAVRILPSSHSALYLQGGTNNSVIDIIASSVNSIAPIYVQATALSSSASGIYINDAALTNKPVIFNSKYSSNPLFSGIASLNITGNITSVTDVTGNVQGNVEGNVNGSVGSILGVDSSYLGIMADDYANSNFTVTTVSNPIDVYVDSINAIRNAITGGAYSLSTDALGMVRQAVGTDLGEINIVSGIVETDIETALTVTPRAMLGQVTPSSTPTILEMLQQRFKLDTNKIVQDGSIQQVYNRAGTTVDQKRAISDLAGLVTLGTLVAGP